MLKRLVIASVCVLFTACGGGMYTVDEFQKKSYEMENATYAEFFEAVDSVHPEDVPFEPETITPKLDDAQEQIGKAITFARDAQVPTEAIPFQEALLDYFVGMDVVIEELRLVTKETVRAGDDLEKIEALAKRVEVLLNDMELKAKQVEFLQKELQK